MGRRNPWNRKEIEKATGLFYGELSPDLDSVPMPEVVELEESGYLHRAREGLKPATLRHLREVEQYLQGEQWEAKKRHEVKLAELYPQLLEEWKQKNAEHWAGIDCSLLTPQVTGVRLVHYRTPSMFPLNSYNARTGERALRKGFVSRPFRVKQRQTKIPCMRSRRSKGYWIARAYGMVDGPDWVLKK